MYIYIRIDLFFEPVLLLLSLFYSHNYMRCNLSFEEQAATASDPDKAFRYTFNAPVVGNGWRASYLDPQYSKSPEKDFIINIQI